LDASCAVTSLQGSRLASVGGDGDAAALGVDAGLGLGLLEVWLETPHAVTASSAVRVSSSLLDMEDLLIFL
jgi:hypothetical protein